MIKQLKNKLKLKLKIEKSNFLFIHFFVYLPIIYCIVIAGDNSLWKVGMGTINSFYDIGDPYPGQRMDGSTYLYLKHFFTGENKLERNVSEKREF